MNRPFTRAWFAYHVIYRWIGAIPVEWSTRDNTVKYRYWMALVEARDYLSKGKVDLALEEIEDALK